MYVLSGERTHTDQAYATGVVLLVVVIIINGIIYIDQRNLRRPRRKRKGIDMDKFNVEHLDLYYGDFKALKDINLKLRPTRSPHLSRDRPFAVKSTFLKSLNRMNDLVEGCKITGKVTLDGEDIYGSGYGRQCAEEKKEYGFSETESFSDECFMTILHMDREPMVSTKNPNWTKLWNVH